MSEPSAACCWPLPRLGEALLHVVERVGGDVVGCAKHLDAAGPPPTDALAFQSLPRWLDDACQAAHLQSAHLSEKHARLVDTLGQTGPAIAYAHRAGAPVVVVILGPGRSPGRVQLLGTDGHVVDVATELALSFMVREQDSAVGEFARARLASLGLSSGTQAPTWRAASGLLEPQPAQLWLVQQPIDAPLPQAAREIALLPSLGRVVALQAAQSAIGLFGWWLFGSMTLAGRATLPLLIGWALVALTQVPLTVVQSVALGRLGLRFGAALRARLLVGVMRADLDALRAGGHGALLSVVTETAAFENLVLGTGLTAVLSLLNLGLAIGVLSQMPSAATLVPFVLLWTTLGAVGAMWVGVRRRRLTQRRIAVDNDLVERMVGHKTRLVQEDPARWHVEEDLLIDAALATARQSDDLESAWGVMIDRGFLVVALALLAPVAWAEGASPGATAATAGALLLAHGALQGVAMNIASILDGLVAFDMIRPLLRAVDRRDAPGVSGADAMARTDGGVVLDVQNLRFKHSEARGPLVLDGVDLQLREGDRALLLGPSGGGKSTLASLLAGQRFEHGRGQQTGLIRLHGLDPATLGTAAWRRRVALVPQFHENHIVQGSLAFNLLMGRRWPAFDEDTAAAREVCHELGLGPLLARMPSGLDQLVGETGWRLSHGEKSRVYLARALLQDADVVLLDESFGALDPDTVTRCLACAESRSRTLVVIAHP